MNSIYDLKIKYKNKISELKLRIEDDYYDEFEEAFESLYEEKTFISMSDEIKIYERFLKELEQLEKNCKD